MIYIFFKQRATRRALRTGRCPHRLTLAPRALRMHGRWRGFGVALMLVGILRPWIPTKTPPAQLALLALALVGLRAKSSCARRAVLRRACSARSQPSRAHCAGQVGSQPSHGGRPTVGCLGGLFQVADGAPGGPLGGLLDRHGRQAMR